MRVSKALAICTLVLGSGWASEIASAQDVFINGYLATSLGGATIGPAAERRLPIHNIGSSGQDGVEINLRTTHGAVAHLDLTSMTDTNSLGTTSECRVKYKGWDGTIKGRYSVNGAFSQGHVLEQCDFSTLGPPGAIEVEITVRRSTGEVVTLPRFHSTSVQWTTYANYGPGEVVDMGMSAGKATIADFHYVCHRSTNRPARLEFLNAGGVIVVLDGVDVMMRPICITAPCPGDWTNLQSMIVTGSGMGEMAIYDPSMQMETVNPMFEEDDTQRIVGVGGGHVAESCCADLDGDGANDDALIVNNIGSSGQDGVEIKWPKKTGSAARKWGNGHVTLMKFTDDEGSEMRVTGTKDDAACTSTFTPDFSGMGTTRVQVTLRDSFGNQAATREMNPGEYVTVLNACAAFGSMIECRKAMGGAPEYCKLSYPSPHACILGAGTVVPGVTSIEMSPINPPRHFGDLARSTKTCKDGTLLVSITLDTVQSPPECAADFNGDGGIDFFDYLDFVDAFSSGC